LKRTVKRPNFFFNPSDLSSLDIMLDGEWEPNLISSIRNLIVEDKDLTLFLDIGANIGLTSIPICNEVARLIAIEPNPVASLILRANLALSSKHKCYTIIEKAICTSSGPQRLVTPKGNLGGAFIDSSDQSLTKAEIEKKEGGNLTIESSTFVPTLSADALFSQIAGDANHKEVDKIIIKIDVEGLENLIIKGLLRSSLWREKRVALFFESWHSATVIEIMRLANTQIFSRETSRANWFIYNQNNFHSDLTEFFLSNYNATPSAEC